MQLDALLQSVRDSIPNCRHAINKHFQKHNTPLLEFCAPLIAMADARTGTAITAPIVATQVAVGIISDKPHIDNRGKVKEEKYKDLLQQI